MPHTHIHLHESADDDPPEIPRKPVDPEPEKLAAQAPPAQPQQPPAQMSPQAAKTAARRLGRTMKIDPQEGLRDVAKYFGDELAGRFTKIAEMMGLDEALADLEDHIAGLAEKKPLPGLGEAARRTGAPARPMPAARDAWEEGKHPRDPEGKFGSGGGGSHWAKSVSRPGTDPGLFSPRGNVSKAANKRFMKSADPTLGEELRAAQERYRKSIQESPAQNLLRNAKQLRELAARGMSTKKFLKQAEMLERKAKELQRSEDSARDAGTFVGARKVAESRKRIGGAGYRIRSGRPSKTQWARFRSRGS